LTKNVWNEENCYTSCCPPNQYPDAAAMRFVPPRKNFTTLKHQFHWLKINIFVEILYFLLTFVDFD